MQRLEYKDRLEKAGEALHCYSENKKGCKEENLTGNSNPGDQGNREAKGNGDNGNRVAKGNGDHGNREAKGNGDNGNREAKGNGDHGNGGATGNGDHGKGGVTGNGDHGNREANEQEDMDTGVIDNKAVDQTGTCDSGDQVTKSDKPDSQTSFDNTNKDKRSDGEKTEKTDQMDE